MDTKLSVLSGLGKVCSIAEIAGALKLKPSTVRRKLNKLGIEPFRDSSPKLYLTSTLGPLLEEDPEKVRATKEKLKHNASVATQAAATKKRNARKARDMGHDSSESKAA